MEKTNKFHFFKNAIYKPEIRMNSISLFYIVALTILSILILNLTTQISKIAGYDQMVSAAQKMKTIYNEIYKYHQENHIPIKKLYDPNDTGFVGEEFSLITTTLGNLDSKQTALNPDFAALMIKWILDLNLSSGDNVVIHASASFPALTMMAIIACEELDLEPVIFTSVGASSWGANIPEFTYLDIENYLYEKKIIKHHSTFVTPGGTNDNGSSLWDGGMEIIEQSANKNNYKLQVPFSLKNSIDQKWNLIKCIDPTLFINIGGNHSALGEENYALKIPVGLITNPLECSEDGLTGLIYKCSKAEIPVFHFLKIKEIAFSNGIDLSPTVFKEPGDSNLYYDEKIYLFIPLIFILLIFLLLIVLKRKSDYSNPSSSSTISTNRK